MTCVIGLIHEDCVYIGADSCAGDGWSSRPALTPKVFRVGEFLIGYTTSFRMGQLLQYHLKLEPQGQIPDEQYIVTIFVEAVRQVFKDKGFTKIENNQETGGLFLVGYRGHLYMIHSDFQALQLTEKYNAIGSGWMFALGAMAALTEEKPKRRILHSLQITAQFSSAVLAPFEVVRL